MQWTKAGMINDIRMFELLKMKASGTLLKKTVEAQELDSNGYAMAWGLVHYLANKKPEELHAYLAEVSRFAPLDESVEPAAGKPDELFVKHFGSDLRRIESSIQTYLTGKKMQAAYVDPIANQTHYLLKCVVKKGQGFERTIQVTLSPGETKKWKEEQEEKYGKNASIYTIICKSKDELERQLRLMKR
jgi:hypothetical protein